MLASSGVGFYSACLWAGALLGLVYAAPFLPPIWALLYWLAVGPTRLDTHPTTGLLSVVIPCRGESDTLEKTVRQVLQAADRPEQLQVVIAVDAASDDATMEVAKVVTAQHRSVVCVRSESPGRGAALQAGVATSSGSLLLMLHSDTLLPPGWDSKVRDALGQPGVLMSAFEFGLDDSTMMLPRGHKHNGVEKTANWRSKWLWLPYGDQALAITRHELEAAGGVPLQMMMEDFELVVRIRKKALLTGGRIQIIDAPIRCSARRWETKGVRATTMWNWIFVFSYVILGWSPSKIHRIYYG
eukprot:TRINITY_DN7047_c0_g1_i2.p1 TRINITY_DN7047_c0_g1~~TRINITY_DN7047_c0_g1_i2.p1  ORF type:complete len:299 (-),score=62.42 TRINITY_DN7047_c0_g1_i2:360-1256(-)